MTHHAGTISTQHDILFELANEERYDRILEIGRASWRERVFGLV